MLVSNFQRNTVYSNMHPLPLEPEPRQGVGAGDSDEKKLKVKPRSHLLALTQRMN